MSRTASLGTSALRPGSKARACLGDADAGMRISGRAARGVPHRTHVQPSLTAVSLRTCSLSAASAAQPPRRCSLASRQPPRLPCPTSGVHAPGHSAAAGRLLSACCRFSCSRGRTRTVACAYRRSCRLGLGACRQAAAWLRLPAAGNAEPGAGGPGVLTCGIGRRRPDEGPLPSHGLGGGRRGRLGLHARLCCRPRCGARPRCPLCLRARLRCVPQSRCARRGVTVHLHRRLRRAAPLCWARSWRVDGCRAGHCRVGRLRAAGRLATQSQDHGQGTPARGPVRGRRQPGLHAGLCSARRSRLAALGSARTLEVGARRQVDLHARRRRAARPAVLPHCRCLLRADWPRGRPRVGRQGGARRCRPVRLPLCCSRSRCLRGGRRGLGGAGARVCLSGAGMRLRLCGARLGRGRAHEGRAQVLLRRLPRAARSQMLMGNQRYRI